MQTTGTSRPSTIRLKSPYGRVDEKTAAATFYPGHLLKVNSSDQVLKHATAGGWAERILALEDAYQGKTVTEAYSSTNPAQLGLFLPGDLALGRIAIGQNITLGDPLISAGDGTLAELLINPTGLLYSQVAESTEHENTTDAADFNVYYNIPANTLRAGDVLHIKANVTVNDNNSTDTLTLLLRLGTTTIATTGAVDVADADQGFFDAYVIIRTIGATGTMVASGLVGLGVPGTVTGKAFALASTAVDTTAALKVNVNADWSVAHADNEASLTGLVVELLRGAGDYVVGVAEESVDNSAGSAEAFLKFRFV